MNTNRFKFEWGLTKPEKTIYFRQKTRMAREQSKRNQEWHNYSVWGFTILLLLLFG
jgi:hypothetical protein